MYACIPGDWYIVTDASNPEDFDRVIHSKNLKIVTKHQLSSDRNSKGSRGLQQGRGTEEEIKVAASSKQAGGIQSPILS